MKKWTVRLLGLLIMGGTAQAAFITWEAGSTVYDAVDPAGWVSQQDELVSAINASDSAAASVTYGGISWVNADDTEMLAGVTQNGVTITAGSGLEYANAFGPGLFSDTDNFYNGGCYSLQSLTLSGLTPGATYQLQVMCMDDRGTDGRWTTFGDGTQSVGDSVANNTAAACPVRSNPAGQAGVLVGTFVADASTQTIDIFGSRGGMFDLDSGSTCQFNALQLRKLIVEPMATLSTAAGNTVSNSFTMNIDFSAAVTGLSESDFLVVNGSVETGSLSGAGTSWSVIIVPTANGEVTVTLPADTVIDGASNPNPESNTLGTLYLMPGSDHPVPTLSTVSGVVTESFVVQIDFTEAVTGLELSDFVVSYGALSNLSGSGMSYSMVVTPTSAGDVTLRLPKHSVVDIDGDNLPNPDSNELVTFANTAIIVNSLQALLPYLDDDNVKVRLAPGTYRISAADVLNGLYPDTTAMLGREHTILLKFSGNNSTYDFSGVTLYVDTGVWHENDYGDNGVYQVETTGNYNVLKNLTMIDDGTVNDDPRDGCVNIVMDGAYNRIEGFHLTIKGSFPYGYGDCFGKGGGPVISHNKHSAFLIRGESNHAKNCTLIHRSYGHAMFMQAASNPIIEGCYIEGEMRSTDDMLLEEGTGSPADNVNFLTVWGDDDDEDRYGYRLPPGYMKSTGEGGIRAYNAGETIIDGVEYDRGTSNPTIINNTIVNMRTGVTLTHASGTKYVAGCKTIGCERGYAIGSGIIENCSGDVQYGPVFGVDYDSNSGIVADITILPHQGEHYNGSRHFAYIFGSNHNLTFRGMEQFPDQELEINVGGDLRIESSLDVVDNRPANNIVINNYTGYPLILDDNSSGNTGSSCGSVTDDGIGNSVASKAWSVTSNITFYGEATQSSTSYDALASLAIDQNTSGDFGQGTVTHTETESQPWWRLDLKKPFEISQIKLWNRTGSSSILARLSNYDVTVLDDAGEVVWTSYQSSYPNPMLALNTGSVIGRYVLVQLRGANVLSLAEVEVFGSEVAQPRDIVVINHGWDMEPIFSTTDLAQTHYESSSATGGNEVATQHAQLFNGAIGDADGSTSDSGEVTMDSGNSVTVTFDTSVHTNGYDLTGIHTYFGGGDRANQGYEVILTYMDGAEATLVGPEHFASNSPVSFYWTEVLMREAEYGVMASGVKSATFNITHDANVGGVVVAREFDIFGTPTVSPRHYIPQFMHSGTTVSNGLFQTHFAGEPGENYTVEWAPSLTNAWEAVTNLSVMSSPMELTIPATESTGFYRVIWMP